MSEEGCGLYHPMMMLSLTAPPGSDLRVSASDDARHPGSFWALTIGSIGVVYGDIGTSPLYAFREAIVAATAGGEVTAAAVLGVLSLIFWARLSLSSRSNMCCSCCAPTITGRAVPSLSLH